MLATDTSATDLPELEEGIALSHRSQAFLAYWNDVRGASKIPAADDVRPSDFISLLPYVRYLRWDGAGSLVFKVWGTALADWMNADLTGRNVFDLLPESERAAEQVRLKNLHSLPCGFVQQRRVTDISGMTRLFEFLTLPVAAGSDGQLRMIGPGSFVDAVPGERVELADDPKTVIHSFRYLDLGFGVPA
ncbi:hypothetical protein BN1012_Phect1557 [Candidatus Phaeomarinobacter ectocarpi]|uniref:PAS domain-containing protein n=1 Tax=Candidatus Phaeomarinibacter ectocarpi TaxID=1458461 RepID=X5MN43_9HYPH|nr:PAS domain-containing protein [Candidatus Phaeomarinobacter ectocarpi]CDO59771.1 hypothetical protein BN1012_Phect1557 [Candidatus Phaeomarinobacter ectocarpi]